MLMRKPLPILGSLTIVGLILVILTLNSIASQETVVLSDAQLMTVQGGECNRACNDDTSCPRPCTKALRREADGSWTVIWKTTHATTVDICGDLEGSKVPCANDKKYVCGYYWTFTDSNCKNGGTMTNSVLSAYGCGGFPVPER